MQKDISVSTKKITDLSEDTRSKIYDLLTWDTPEIIKMIIFELVCECQITECSGEIESKHLLTDLYTAFHSISVNREYQILCDGKSDGSKTYPLDELSEQTQEILIDLFTTATPEDNMKAVFYMLISVYGKETKKNDFTSILHYLFTVFHSIVFHSISVNKKLLLLLQIGIDNDIVKGRSTTTQPVAPK